MGDIFFSVFFFFFLLVVVSIFIHKNSTSKLLDDVWVCEAHRPREVSVAAQRGFIFLSLLPWCCTQLHKSHVTIYSEGFSEASFDIITNHFIPAGD